MSARAHAVVGSLPRSSVPTSPVCSITANTAGRAYIPVPDGSSTNRWWRREATALVTSRSAGAEPRADPATSTGVDNKEGKERALPQGLQRSGNLCIRSRFLKKKWVFLLLLLSFTVILLNSTSSIMQNHRVCNGTHLHLWLTPCLLGTLISYTWPVCHLHSSVDCHSHPQPSGWRLWLCVWCRVVVALIGLDWSTLIFRDLESHP